MTRLSNFHTKLVTKDPEAGKKMDLTGILVTAWFRDASLFFRNEPKKHLGIGVLLG